MNRVLDAAEAVKSSLHGWPNAAEVSKSIDSFAESLGSIYLELGDGAFFESHFQMRSISFQDPDSARQGEADNYGIVAIFSPGDPVFESSDHLTLLVDWKNPAQAKVAITLHELWVLKKMDLIDLKEITPEVHWSG
ncbi:hypothetical protein LCL97_07310 [Seohaeicola saemankumensis]|nr:hypothetical protein [Seohaeicola saemankumensis]MCA0870625.1 hypothetical protein [Seohaeicola saemankumensis]